jgi:flagellar biosynthesis protein FlhF
MQVQRFRNQSVREALAAVRRSLGPDALVLSTAMVPMRGWRRFTGRREVEVTAALAPSVSESRPETPSDRPTADGSPNIAPRTIAPEGPGSHDLVARLCASGIDRGLATEVAAALPPKVRRDPSQKILLEALSARLAPLAAGDEPFARVQVFVGPPGVGKTTTIAKLAAQARAREARRLTLVAADGYRVGAVEQLRLYAEILGAPFVVARTAADLERAIAADGGPMLVDTAGRSPADRGVRDLFDVLSGRPGVGTHLVLAAGTSPRDARRILERYREAQPTRVVLTKVDETDSIAPLIGVIRASGLRVSWIGHGQRVPDDLATVTADLLAAAATGELGGVLANGAAGGQGEATCV